MNIMIQYFNSNDEIRYVIRYIKKVGKNRIHQTAAAAGKKEFGDKYHSFKVLEEA